LTGAIDVGKKYVIIHGHFYQPPRENPWIDVIETQVSAAPSHDWNERVYDECYRPNAYSRLLDAQGAIVDIHNNYCNMSFNFGPTLFTWLEQRHIATARRIVEADQTSCAALGGHGNAMAQVFNHIIMPLASRRDQLTQIRWAKRFFKDRFKRDPEGMWLAETAINMETARCLIEENIRFVVLAPSQANGFRPIDGNGQWSSGPIDTKRPYRLFQTDRSGNRQSGFIDVFFFDMALSREASFGVLLTDAHIFGKRINGLFDRRGEDQAVVLASDGETFGHHKPFGDMCLAFFFKRVAPELGITPVNFAWFLENNPPRHEVQLKSAFGEGTAWSCAHGVGRWVRDCGCSTGGKPTWKQTWRTPLRAVLTALQENIDREFETALAADQITDPWALRDAYIQVIDDPSYANFTKLLESRMGGAKFSRERVLAVRRLLEAQKYMLYAFTSCGWFFSDISGIEAIQNLAYALRALQLGIRVEDRHVVLKALLKALEAAKSNLPNSTGRSLFEKKILPFINHEKLIAFTAVVEKIVSIDRADKVRIFKCDVSMRRLCSIESGHLSYHGFEVSLDNSMTGEQSRWAVLVSHREWAELRGWVVAADDFGKKLNAAVEPEDWMKHPGVLSLTLTDIFQASRENMVEYIHQNIFKDTYVRFSAWMQKNEQELDFLSRLNFPLAQYCMAPLSFVYNQQWNHLIRRLEQRGDEEEIALKLRDLFAVQDQFMIKFDLKEGAGLIERIIIMELSALSIRLDTETCERIRYLLNIVDRFGIPVLKHKMEDVFCPILNGPILDLYNEVKRLAAHESRSVSEQRALNDKKILAAELVNFARRMNFNIDQFKPI
jgi:alpha-amylase/alpha-mannosidase (GH57 family)